MQHGYYSHDGYRDSVDTYFTDAKMLRMDRVGPKGSKQ